MREGGRRGRRREKEGEREGGTEGGRETQGRRGMEGESQNRGERVYV